MAHQGGSNSSGEDVAAAQVICQRLESPHEGCWITPGDMEVRAVPDRYWSIAEASRVTLASRTPV